MYTPPSSTSAPSLQGAIVGGKYRVEKMIGSGGMGTVWLGEHVKLGTRVAIKFIRPQYASMEDARKRFEIEARAAAKLQTIHAVQVFDYGVTDDGLPYIVMEYLEGESLSDALIKRGPMPAPEVARIIGQAAQALSKAHAAGVVHRDLKPDNIFLATNAENPNDGAKAAYVVKLVDFGIAKLFDAPRVAGLETPPALGGPTQEGAVIGTPNFMAPEQLTLGGAPGPLTDLWSLGACAYSAMTARIPFEGDVLGDIVIKVCASPLPVPSQINPDVPLGFDAWFARACSRDPSKRFQSATELAESLANVCGVGRVRAAAQETGEVQYVLKRSALATPIDSIPVPSSSMSPRTALLAGLVLGVTTMVGIAGALAWREKMQADGADTAGSATAATVDAGAGDARR
jgi:serine/threonine-protein kinase